MPIKFFFKEKSFRNSPACERQLINWEKLNAIIVTGGHANDEAMNKVKIDETSTRGHPEKQWQLIRRLRTRRLFHYALSNQGRAELKNAAIEQKIENIAEALDTITTFVGASFLKSS